MVFTQFSSLGKYIIYGYSIEVYSCMATLLEIGIIGEDIYYIRPKTGAEKDGLKDYLQFNNHNIRFAVNNQIISNGITVFEDYLLVDWKVNPKTFRVETVRFESRHKIIELPCLGFFCYGAQSVSKRTLSAIINAGLVFDGKIVIDKDCRTNDPYIYAAGTCTKYARKLYADHLNHEYYNIMEIGFKMGKRIKEKLTKNYAEIDEVDLECTAFNPMMMVFKWPLVTVCKLPGDLNYVYIRKPGKPVPSVIKRDADDYVSYFFFLLLI